jgi:uncharacterized SAM-binding protein YcdF (DUF218 family)
LIRRIFLSIVLVWLLGLAWFALTLPGPLDGVRTDGIVVLTGGRGRLARGLVALDKGWSTKMLVSGVDKSVKPGEFIEINKVPANLLKCCIELGQRATDTVTNGQESANWIRTNNFRSVRLITSDWHMRRARLELEGALNGRASIVSDGVRTAPALRVIMLEYHKYVLRRLSILFGY